jgi:hypothetical protein
MRSMKCYDLDVKTIPQKLGDRPLGMPWTPHHLNYKCIATLPNMTSKNLTMLGPNVWTAPLISILDLAKTETIRCQSFCVVKNSFELVSVIECPFRIMAVLNIITTWYYFAQIRGVYFQSNFEHIMNPYYWSTVWVRFSTNVICAHSLSSK